MTNMMTEIVAFIMTTSGWVLISSTIPTDDWKVDGAFDDSILEDAMFWSNLWKTCVTDATGITNCKDFPSMLALDGYIQACRGLMIAAACLGFFGAIFALVGMKCTKIGGSDQNKARIACFAGVNFIFCGLCSMSACSLYAHRITSEFFDPIFVAQKYELGAALFVGWTGSSLCVVGGVILCFSIANSFNRSSNQPGYAYRATTATHVPATPRGHPQTLRQGPSQEQSSFSAVQHFDKNVYV